MRIIGYSYDATIHCIQCAERDAAVGIIKRMPPLRSDVDENGLAYDLVDSDENPINPIFSTDELCGDCCDDCFARIES